MPYGANPDFEHNSKPPAILLAQADRPAPWATALVVAAGVAYVKTLLRSIVVAGFLALALSACAAQPTPYKPNDGSFGYSETQIDAQTWRVEFAGNADTTRETVENYLLYRAAEVMLFGGYERFIVLEKEVERTRDIREYGPYPPHVGIGAARHHRARHFGLHYGYAPYHSYALERYRAVATIRTFTDASAPAGLQVYAAREVVAQLGPRIVLPR